MMHLTSSSLPCEMPAMPEPMAWEKASSPKRSTARRSARSYMGSTQRSVLAPLTRLAERCVEPM